MKRFVIFLLVGLLLLGAGVALRMKYDDVLNREVIHLCEQCYEGEADLELVDHIEGTVACKCGTFLTNTVVYTNEVRLQEDWDRYGDIYRGAVYGIIFGGIFILLGVMDGLRAWSERNGC